MDVSEDPDLSPEEKQFSLTMTKADDCFHVHSEIATTTKWLLDHPAVEITDVREREGVAVACSGRLPVGLVKLSAKPRSNDQVSGMLSSATLRVGDADE